jgi:hypothetical protein
MCVQLTELVKTNSLHILKNQQFVIICQLSFHNMCISYCIIIDKKGGEIVQRFAEECSSTHLKWPQLSVFDIIPSHCINTFLF